MSLNEEYFPAFSPPAISLFLIQFDAQVCFPANGFLQTSSYHPYPIHVGPSQADLTSSSRVAGLLMVDISDDGPVFPSNPDANGRRLLSSQDLLSPCADA